MTESFCQVCRHLSPGHQPGCPVATQEPQRGMLAEQGFVESTVDQGLPNQLGAEAGQPAYQPKAQLTRAQVRLVAAAMVLALHQGSLPLIDIEGLNALTDRFEEVLEAQLRRFIFIS